MAPGGGGLPPAAGDPGPDGQPAASVDVAGPLERFVAHVPRRTARRLRLALRAFDLLPFPWRFSRSSLEARREYLARLDSRGRGLRGDLLLLLKVLVGLGYGGDERVRVAVGYEARCELDGPGEPPPGPRLAELDPDPGGEDCDVAVVGSGAGGAVAATILAEAGLDVLVLEAGPYLDRRDYPREPLEALTALYRDGGLTIAEGVPAIPMPVGRAVGGTTVINSGTCYRAPEDVLSGWRERSGIEWATELNGEYSEAEEMLAVAPVDPDRMGRNGQLLRDGAIALGARHEPLRRNAGPCVQCSSCPLGCRLDAKRAMHVSYLPRAAAAGARIRSGVEVRRIVTRGTRATGLEARANGAPYRVNARRAIVLAGGAIGTPELMLRSGFHSRGSQLGRNLHIHPACWVGARFDEPVRGWEGVMQSYAVTEWQRRRLLLEATFTPLAFGAQWLPGTGHRHAERMLAFDRIASTGVHLSDRSAGRVGLTRRGELRVTYSLRKEDARALAFGIGRAAELFYAAGAREVYPQISGIPVIDPGRIQELESSPPPARALRLEAFHPMGSARMDADPGRGVVGTDGSVHGADALYIADGSLMPTSTGVNPMMTIMAFASRVGRGLADHLIE